MAVITGSTLEVTVGTSSTLPRVISVNLPETRTMIDVTAAGDATTVSVPGLGAGSFTVEAWLDLSNSTLESAVTGGTTTAVTVELDGSTIASFASCYVTRSIQSGGPNGASKATYTFHAAA